MKFRLASLSNVSLQAKGGALNEVHATGFLICLKMLEKRFLHFKGLRALLVRLLAPIGSGNSGL